MAAKLIYVPVAVRHDSIEMTMYQHSEHTRGVVDARRQKYADEQTAKLAELNDCLNEGYTVQANPTLMTLGSQETLVYLLWRPD